MGTPGSTGRSRTRRPRRHRRRRRLGAPGARCRPRIRSGSTTPLRARRRQLLLGGRIRDRRWDRSLVEGEAGFRVALGAVDPLHPVPSLAMSGRRPSTRCSRAGSSWFSARGCRCNSSRMGSGTTRCSAVERVSKAMDQIRGCRPRRKLYHQSPPNAPPTHGSHSVITAYRKEFVALAGQGGRLLHRPRQIDPERVAQSRDEHQPAGIRARCYLLSLVDATPARGAQPGQARAVRHLHDVRAVRCTARPRAGFKTPDLRRPDRHRHPWQAEDYTTAGNLIPDELLDAFMLCGTREDVAAKAMAFHARPSSLTSSSSPSSRRTTRSTS